MMRWGFVSIGWGLVSAAFWVGTLHLNGIWLLLIMGAMSALVTMALRLDYVLLSKPKHLKTWTLRSLNAEVAIGTEGRESEYTSIYVETPTAYSPIDGAFLATINHMPAVVLQPRKLDA